MPGSFENGIREVRRSMTRRTLVSSPTFSRAISKPIKSGDVASKDSTGHDPPTIRQIAFGSSASRDRRPILAFRRSIRRIGTLNLASLRAAVQSDIDAFRATRLPSGTTHFVSDFSGRTYLVQDVEVDHVPTFQEIVSRFYSARGIDVESLLLTRAVDEKSEPAWRSEAMIGEFRAYHRGFELRLVSSLENQSDIKRLVARSASLGEKEGG